MTSNMISPVMKNVAIIMVVFILGTMQALVHAETGDGFGRLFSRPNERSNLDVLRQNQKLKVAAPQPVDTGSEAPAPVALPDPITLQGYVKRSDGSSTVWINNQPVQEGSTVDNVNIGRLNENAKQGTLDVKIPANGKHIRLKAGQIYEPETNQIKELRIQEKERQLDLETTGVIDGHDSPTKP